MALLMARMRASSISSPTGGGREGALAVVGHQTVDFRFHVSGLCIDGGGECGGRSVL